MTIGLDIDDRFTTVARDGVEPTTERTNFVELPGDEMVLDMLSSGDVEYVERDGAVYAVGDAATDFAGMFDAPVESLLRGGVLTGERDVDAVLAELLIEQVLGVGEEEQAVFTVPSEPVDRTVETLFHRRTIDDRLAALGYEPESITRGVAAGYEGFGSDAPTGLSVVLGTGTSEVCLLDDGHPVVQFGLGRGGSWIDRQVAGATDRDPGAVADERETYDLTTGDGDVLGMYYENFLSYVVDAVIEHSTDEADSAVLPVVVAGPAARPAGIGETLGELLAEADPSFEVDEIRVFDDPVTAVARGARLAPDVEHSSVETTTAVGSGSTSKAATVSGQSSSGSGTDEPGEHESDAPETPGLATTVDVLDERIADLRERVDTQAEQTTVAELGESVDALEARLAEIKDEELGSLASELDAVAADIEQVRGRLDDLAERQHSLDSRLDETPNSDLDETVANLDDALSELHEEIDGIHSRIEELETVATQPADGLLDRLDDIEATLDSRGDLQSDVEALDETIATTGDTLDSTVERIDGLESDLDALMTEIERIEDLETHLDDVEARADTAIERTDRVVSRLDDVEASTETAREQHAEIESRIESVEQELSSAGERVDDLDETVGEQDSRVGTVELSIETMDERVDSVEGSVATVEELETTLDDLGIRHDGDVEALHADLDELELQVESMIETDDGPSEEEIRDLAGDIARERVLAPAAGGVGAFGLLAAGGAAVADALVLAGVFAAFAIVCFGVLVRVR